MPKADGPLGTTSRIGQIKDWQREFEAQKRRVLNAAYVEQGLSALVKHGADRDRLLTHLVMTLPIGDPYSLRQKMQTQSEKLLSQSDELAKAAHDLDSSFETETGFATFWRFFLFPLVSSAALPDFAEAKKALKWQSNNLRKLAGAIRQEALAFKRLARYYPRANEKVYLARFLRYVYESTGQFHERTLAFLLTSAHNELGAEVDYSEDKLKKFRQRNLKDLTRSRSSRGHTAETLDLCFLKRPLKVNGRDKATPKN